MGQTLGITITLLFPRWRTEAQSVHLTGSDTVLFSLPCCYSLEVRGERWEASGLKDYFSITKESSVNAPNLPGRADHISPFQPMSGWRPQGAFPQLSLSFSQVEFPWNYIVGGAGALICGTCQFLWCKCRPPPWPVSSYQRAINLTTTNLENVIIKSCDLAPAGPSTPLHQNRNISSSMPCPSFPFSLVPPDSGFRASQNMACLLGQSLFPQRTSLTFELMLNNLQVGGEDQRKPCEDCTQKVLCKCHCLCCPVSNFQQANLHI